MSASNPKGKGRLGWSAHSPRHWRHKRALLLVGLVALLAAGGAVYARTRPVRSPFVTATARYGTVTDTVVVSGTLQPVQSWDLSFPAPGVVATVDVTPGQTVTAGQLLATLDPATLQAELTQAEANLTIAEAKLSLAEAASPAPAAAQIAIDQAEVTIAQTAVASAQAAVNSTHLTAPAAGVVAQINVTAGQPDGASSVRAAANTTDIVIDGLGAFEVAASVSDAQVAQVHVGQPALVTPAGQARPMPGKVSAITPLATIVQGVAAFPVVITVTGSPPGLFAGAAAEAAIVVQRVAHVLTIPASTVHGSGSRGTYVLVVKAGRAVKQTVKIGATDTILAQVASGLALGDQVVLAQINKPLPSGAAGLLGRRGAGGGAKARRGAKGGGGIP
ncbi:MAG: efflux RND transporter periplasmic adaptor subunit [Candidatus Dormibacteraeota bacterium]|nr:efflux RND transporter periplasmic adaptor subunit [Candidatus Dormibacteraeota bacterium]